MDALGPREEEASGCCRALAHTLKQDVLSRSAGHAQHTHRETQRLMKKRQQCLDALLSTNTPADQQRRRRRTRDQPEAELTRTHDNEGACPVGVAQGRIDTTIMHDNEGVCPVGVAQGRIDTTVMHDNEGVCPVGVAQGRIDTTVMHDNEGVCPVGVAQGRIDSTRTHDNEGAWPLALGSIDSSERLFVFRCAPPTAQQHTHKKKRSFLNFKKSSVAPQPHT
nr:uncharacterized protein LOC110440195 [Danio rerio]|eukprot:XP_021336751.1 uncharacterized protein LOC110440195 [Danio rerio]